MKRCVLTLCIIATLIPTICSAQKVKEAELQPAKEDSLTIYKVWKWSMIVPGAGQFINKQYYKIPVFYAGIGGLAYLGYRSNQKYHEAYAKYKLASNSYIGTTSTSNFTFSDLDKAVLYKNNLIDIENTYVSNKYARNICYTAAGAAYLLSIADAIVNFDDQQEHSVAKATILSALIPGLGQAYNGKYWKMPLIYGGFAGFGYGISFNGRQYKRYRTAYNLLTDTDANTIDEFNGRRTAEELKSSRDYYRRNRDYTILGAALLYALNIIDAHVDATLYDYDVSDNLSLRVEPTFINENYNFVPGTELCSLGMRLTLKF